MLKIFALIYLAYITLQAVNALTFECRNEPEVCKTKFGTQFENEFIQIHKTGMRALLKTYVDKMTAVKTQVPSDNPYSQKIEEMISFGKIALQKLNDNMKNDQKYEEAIEEAMSVMKWDVNKDTPGRKEFHKVLKSLGVQNALVDVFQNVNFEAGNLWANMYKGLRKKDLKAYPEYAEVNGLMKYLRRRGERPASTSDFTTAAKILAEQFGLNFFRMVPDSL